MHVTRDLFHEVCAIRELFVFGREIFVSLRFLRQWLIQNVTHEFCSNLCVKWDHDPPFATLYIISIFTPENDTWPFPFFPATPNILFEVQAGFIGYQEKWSQNQHF